MRKIGSISVLVCALLITGQNYANAGMLQNKIAVATNQLVMQSNSGAQMRKLNLKEYKPELDAGKMDNLSLNFNLNQNFDDLNLKDKNTKALMLKYMNIVSDGDVNKLESFYSKIIKKYPDSPYLYMFRAVSYVGFLNSDDSEKYIEQIKSDCDKAVELAPRLKDAYCFRGVMFWIINMATNPEDTTLYRKAVYNFDKAIELDPEFKEAYRGRGVVKCSLKDYTNAIADLTKAIELDSNYVDAYINRGAAKALTLDYAGAIEDYNKVIELDNKNKDAYFGRAITEYKAAYYTAAIADYNKVIELDDQNADAYIKRGVAKYALNVKGAFEDFTRANEINPRNALTYNNMGMIFYLTTDYKAALDSFNQAIELNNELAKAYYNRGLVKYNIAKAQSDYLGICEDFTKAVNLLTKENTPESLALAKKITKAIEKLQY